MKAFPRIILDTVSNSPLFDSKSYWPLVLCFNQVESSGLLKWGQRGSNLELHSIKSPPGGDRFGVNTSVFMVSIASLKPSSMQYDVHLGHFDLPDFIFDDKAGYALGRSYVWLAGWLTNVLEIQPSQPPPLRPSQRLMPM